MSESYDQTYDRLIGEMLAVTSRAVGLARYYLRDNRPADAQKVLDECSALKRDLGRELFDVARVHRHQKGGIYA